MRLPIWEIISSLTLFATISTCTGVIAYKFYKSVDGHVRILQMELFTALSFAFGLYGIYYALWDFEIIGDYPAVFIRIVCNAGLCYSILRYLAYFSRK